MLAAQPLAMLDVAASVPPGDDWLRTPERVVCARFTRAARRAEWRLGRWTAKRAVAACLGLSRAEFVEVEIRADADGAPTALVGDAPAPVSISLSHRAGASLCAALPAGGPIGCDLELVEPRSAEFVQDYLTEAERALVERAVPSLRPRLTALVWSAKESALKTLRTGLRADTREVEVCVGSAAPRGGWWPLVVRVAGRGCAFAGWWRPHRAHVLCVVAEAPTGPPRLL
jgi:4'-phosphopantetheinyl transferase